MRETSDRDLAQFKAGRCPRSAFDHEYSQRIKTYFE